MYPYHNLCLKRIRNGELISVEKASGDFAVILIFSTEPYTRPIRKHSLYRYVNILKSLGYEITSLDSDE